MSSVDDGHVPFVVALASGGREVVQPFDLLGAQLDAIGRCVLLNTGDPLGAGIGAMSSPWASSQATAICAGGDPHQFGTRSQN